MKLLMISNDRKIFEMGSAVALRQIEYAKHYEEVHIINFAKKDFKEISLAPNLFVYPTRSLTKLNYIFDALRLGRFIVQKRGITHVTCQDPFETGLVGAFIKNREKISLELQIHVDITSPYFTASSFANRIRMQVLGYTLARADSVRVVLQKIKEYISKTVPESNITVRPIAVDLEKIKNALVTTDLHKKYPQFSKIVLMASRLEKEKNIEMALAAWKMVCEKNPSAGLVIIGSGSEEARLREIVKNLNLENSVIFEGWQNELATYYKTCDLFLLTSWYEGYGMTLVEAKAAGANIVSTDVGIAREIGADIVATTPEDISRGIIRHIG